MSKNFTDNNNHDILLIKEILEENKINNLNKNELSQLIFDLIETNYDYKNLDSIIKKYSSNKKSDEIIISIHADCPGTVYLKDFHLSDKNMKDLKVGNEVKEGNEVLIMEAMKMTIPIPVKFPEYFKLKEGYINKIYVEHGEHVDSNQLLFDIVKKKI